MDSGKTRVELLAALIAQKLISGGLSIERAVWLSTLAAGTINLFPMPEIIHKQPKDHK